MRMETDSLDRNLESMEMAKKRDHKVMITDEAINKVPSIKYRHIPKEQHYVITELAREALIVSKDENESNEVAITYRMCDTSTLSEDQRRNVLTYTIMLMILKDTKVRQIIF